MKPPLAPLYPWLRDALGHQVVRSSAGLPRFASSHYPTPYEIDLRDLQTRTAVLRALAEAGHARPWALGAPWSPLTDEQAGRATAEILRAVGEDPARPVGVVPIGVLSGWTPHHIRAVAGAPIHGWVRGDAGWRLYNGGTNDHQIAGRGPETGDAGRLAADNAARNLGCLFIEELTPT